MVLLLLLAGCARHETPLPAARPRPAAPKPVVVAAPPAHAHTYDGAVQQFRESRGMKFDIAIGKVKASGEMTRPTPGMERVTFNANGAQWTAEAKPSGVVWSRDGKRETSEPPWADRIFQWMTLYLDPPKAAPPQTAGTETIDGIACDHVRFTNANTGEACDAWIAQSDGHLVRVKTAGSGDAFPATELTVKR
jgi:hypothetical protein